ncbi:MAG: hypothetical protein AAF711_08415 [Planctomycetota bacterium]
MPHGNAIDTGEQEWQLDLTCNQQTLARYEAQQNVEISEVSEQAQPRATGQKETIQPRSGKDLTEGLFRLASHINALINIVLKLCAAGIFLYILLYLFAGG